MTTTRLRGRAAQPLRPGLITKAILSGNIPLRVSRADPGKLVKEAAITDIHSTYKVLTQEENTVRPRDKRLKGMSYASFITMFRFAKCLRLVEKVREEPLLFPPPNVTLLSIRKPGDIPEVVESKRAIYRLTQIGVEDELAWTNLRKAWAERWPVPQKSVTEAPEIVIPPMAPVIEEKPVARVKPKRPELSETPSTAQFRKLLAYLKGLRDFGASIDEIRKELYDISGITADWTVWIEDRIETVKAPGQKSKLMKWIKHIREAAEGFLDEDLSTIISSLEKLV